MDSNLNTFSLFKRTYINRNQGPCRNCTERHVGCHGNCVEETAFTKRMMEVWEEKKLELLKDDDVDSYGKARSSAYMLNRSRKMQGKSYSKSGQWDMGTYGLYKNTGIKKQ